MTQIPEEKEESVEINMPDDVLAKHSDLQREMQGQTFDIIARIFKSRTGRRITTSGEKNFKRCRIQLRNNNYSMYIYMNVWK